MSVKLEPCPFCGAEAEHYEQDAIWGDSLKMPPNEHVIRCSNMDCPIGPEAIEDTLAKAIESWNTRIKKEYAETLKETEIAETFATYIANCHYLQSLAIQIVSQKNRKDRLVELSEGARKLIKNVDRIRELMKNNGENHGG